MGQDGNAGSEARFAAKATAESHFSWMRTRLGLERTPMAWVRTAVALIGFGFTIAQFFERLPQFGGVATARFPEAPRYVGLVLVLCGVGALAVSAWEHPWSLRYLWSDDFKVLAGAGDRPMWTPLYATTLVLLFVGSAIFLSLLTRIF